MEGLILAGGKSRRMGGVWKGALVYNQQSFLERIAGEFEKETDKVWVSYGGQAFKSPGARYGVVADIFPGCGPMGGLHAGLLACGSESVMVAACDMPFLEIGLYRHMREKLGQAGSAGAYEGVVPVVEGRLHPLAAIYRREAAGIFEEQIKSGNYRLTDGLKRLKLFYIDVTTEKRLRKMLYNVNTKEDYAALAGTPSGGGALALQRTF